MPEPHSPDHRSGEFACDDERTLPPDLPLLFCVDWVLDRLDDGTTYVPNCSEVRYCATVDGTGCLQHLLQTPRCLSIWPGPPAGRVRDPMISGLRIGS